MSTAFNLLEFPDRAAASMAAADRVAKALRACLERKPRCSLVVSGGSTPGPCFDRLAETHLDWSRVVVTPSDERWVPAEHPDSNERLVRERLLTGHASGGQFLPLYCEGMSAEQAESHVASELSALGGSFSCTLLGMGEDGHFASLFPDFDGLDAALSPDNTAPCMAVRTAGSPHVRMSLTLARLLDTQSTILLIFGAEKRRVLEAAADGETSYPIASLLKHHTGPLDVVWAA